ncbi:Ras family protein [Brugia pahangi]
MAQNSGLTIVFIGSSEKEELLEKIKSTAIQCERHINYQDTYYLTYIVDGSEANIELIDSGIEHTGARQMSIRKAHGVILFYRISSQNSVNQLYDVALDFQIIENKIKPPLLLIGNEDVDEKCPEPIIPLASQKYKSNSVHPLMVENTVSTKTAMDLNHKNNCNRYGSTKITTIQVEYFYYLD